MNKDNRGSHLIFFGNKDDSVFLKDIQESRFSFELQNLVQDFGLQRFVGLHQVHGAAGVIVDEKFSFFAIPRANGDQDITKNISQPGWFDYQGDFLITNQKNVGLVVLTADCVPFVLYDPVVNVVGVVHAGWKGSYTGILQTTLQVMQKHYETDVANIRCSFGPSARLCCYEVSQSLVQDFEKKYSDFVNLEKVFNYKNSRFYFDNSLFLQQLLKKFGILSENIYTDNALCTICNPQFCSFRKEKEFSKRQVTMVALF